MMQKISLLCMKRTGICVEISYEVEGEVEKISGIILDYSKNYLLVAEYVDFIFREYTILKREYIFNCSQGNKIYSEILHQHISLNELKCKFLLNNLDSMEHILTRLLKCHPLISLSSTQIKWDYYKVGLIQNIEENKLVLKTITADGNWGEKKFYAPYRSITCISFGSLYNSYYYDFVTSREISESIRK